VLAAAFVAYIVAGILAHPDWAAAGQGLVVPSLPAGKEALVAVAAGIGTTLAPWGLVFIQSYAVDKHLSPDDIGYERVDVVTGALMTGVIGFLVIIACAATLHRQGVKIDDAADAARALEPFAGGAASALFGIGFLGAALIGVAVVPLSTAYSVAETTDQPANIDMAFGDARVFYVSYGAALMLAGAVASCRGCRWSSSFT
jgi:Mn2+/Fe2+ NRAMP family transporter